MRKAKTMTKRCHQGMSEAAEAEPSASYLGTKPRACGNEVVGDVLEDEQLFSAALFALNYQFYGISHNDDGQINNILLIKNIFLF
jgi:hypothetical protein